ncbi:hypothetical protein [uncultured Clostridium sp.]|uniref:hypothetical protein n=1 Tax=uncultured Clostridium sp. TaxID=59620 RepID=UPI0025D6D10B|nr:hypothetical protein [uncultured Clostridium sp.]
MESYRQIIIISYDDDLNIIKTQNVTEKNVNTIKTRLHSIINNKYEEDDEGYVFFRDANSSYISKVAIFKNKKIIHTIIKENGYFDNYPVTYINSKILNIDYKNITLYELEKIAIGEEINTETVSKFVSAKPDNNYNESRIRILKRLINILIMSKEEQKKIILKDTEDNCLMWIGALSFLFPVKLAHDISFNTLGNGIDNNFDINCVKEKNDITISLYVENESKYYIHDLIEGLESKPTIDTRYANLAQIGYTISYNNIKAVTTFMDKFNYRNIRKDIDDCYSLYSFIYTMSSTEAERVIKGIEFLDKYGDKHVKYGIINILELRITSNICIVSNEVALAFIDLMHDVSEGYSDDKFYKKSFRFLAMYINELTIMRKYMKAEDVINFFEDIYHKNEDNRYLIIKYLLGKANANYIKKYIEDDRVIDIYSKIINIIGNDEEDAEWYVKVLIENRLSMYR